MKKGALVISLDFELIWGIFDHVAINDKVAYFNNTLWAIPQMLDLFQKKEIKVTWATVGMLFNENWEEWYANMPQEIPTYDRAILNPYAYGEQHRKSGYDNYFFAPKLIKDIQSVEGQEIGTHTYSHYYCLEKGQTLSQFEADIQQAVSIASKYDLKIKSLVFPRNQFNKDYLEVCRRNQIETVRTNPEDWYWDTTKPDTLLSKMARTGDAYLSVGRKSYPWNKISKDSVVCQPSSRFLRPQCSVELLNKTRLNRIKSEMKKAAKNGEVYHLWWHPHNFGVDSLNAISSLKQILETFVYCNEKYGMQSLTMTQSSTNWLEV
jgi:peptidoglycan/xylan/chitin deacetylase (PgdA/CDA1 family)